MGRSIAPVFLREFLVRLLQTALIVMHMFTPWPFGWFLAAFAGTFVLTTLLMFLDLWRAGKLGLSAANVQVPRRLANHMARYALFGLGVGVAGVATGNVDQMMLAAMLPNGLNYVAYYAVALFLASVNHGPRSCLGDARTACARRGLAKARSRTHRLGLCTVHHAAPGHGSVRDALRDTEHE